MKEIQTISPGNRVIKRQNCDELIRNFHKKLKIEDDNKEIVPIPLKQHTSTALVMYKNPSTPLTPNNIPKGLLKNMDTQLISSSDSILISSNYLKMEHLFDPGIEKKEVKIDDEGSEMVLD